MSFRKYGKYKESGIEWLGEVPAHWVVTQIKYVAQINPSKSELKTIPPDTPVTFLPMESIGETGRLDIRNSKPLSEVVSAGYTYLAENDVIIAKITPCFENGKGAIATGLLNGIAFATTEVVPFRCFRINNQFLYFLLSSSPFRKIAEGSMYGAGGQKRVSDTFFANYKCCIPPTDEEQKRIAAFLDKETTKIDTLIDKQEQLITLLQEKRQAIISHAVIRGLDPSVKMKDSGIEWLREVPEHWEVKKLKHIVTKPLMYGANEAAIDDDRDQPRFVRITDIRNNGTLREETFRSLPWHLAKSYMLREGDVLLARSGATVGKSFIYSSGWGECCFAGYLIKASIDISKASPYWFYRYTESDYYWNWISSILIQATIQNVSAEKYNNFSLCIPPKQEQLKIISYLDKETAIELLKERRTALISAAVTGKIDVRRAV